MHWSRQKRAVPVPGGNEYYSLSHKGLDVSYCENRAAGKVGLLL